MPAEQGTHDIVTEAIAADVVLYNLKIPGYNPPQTLLYAAMVPGLVNIHKVMDETGGELFNVQDIAHLDPVFRALIQRIKTRYTLGYYTNASAALGKPHKLDVRLASSFGKKGKDYVILSKNGFYVHTRARGQIEHAVTRARAGDPRHRAPPQPHLARGQDVVQQVVAPRDGVEHRRHLAGSLV